jgi:cold-inducible RNA-binding protein
MEAKLYVGNLPYSTTEGDLRLLFAQAGEVASVDLIQDRQTGRSKGFAFVVMSTQADAQKAISMFHSHSVADRELNVTLAKPREAQGHNGGRLSPFAQADRKGNVRKVKETGGGYQSRLSAFEGSNGLGGARRRGASKRD